MTVNVKSVPHVGLVVTATDEESSAVVNTQEVKLLSNDGALDITFNFENNTSAANAFVLKAGEKITNWNIKVGRVYFISTGDCAFRLIGTRL